ncbi:hypothetical protein SBRCBS47491_003798 [Sporothrix bragantina]|uniref:Ecp2 effector protein-like domain-containing protein n=1 Tax=Sporothrix bragantina TaxID=671064 RepID=A0ABP0BIA4_9PEZI
MVNLPAGIQSETDYAITSQVVNITTTGYGCGPTIDVGAASAISASMTSGRCIGFVRHYIRVWHQHQHLGGARVRGAQHQRLHFQLQHGLVRSPPPAEFLSIGYYEGYQFDWPCLYQDASQIDTSKFTYIHYAFTTINTDYTFGIGTGMNRLSGLRPFVLNTGSPCATVNPLPNYMSPDTMHAAAGCYQDRLCYLVMPPGETPRRPTGIGSLVLGNDWGNLTRQDLIIGLPPTTVSKCGDSAFVDQTSDVSPPVADCMQIVNNIEGTDGDYSIHKAQTGMLQSSKCIFGIEGPGGNIANQDAIDLTRDSVAKFDQPGKIDAKDTMDCGSGTVTWGIY